ncbi:hypothetical protein [Gluconobacter sp. OJB]|uniref:hypothetical protein n=1 Tax=Gluconobacter sp. OJB TaxID=3145196 RepID=UPI0031F903C8
MISLASFSQAYDPLMGLSKKDERLFFTKNHSRLRVENAHIPSGNIAANHNGRSLSFFMTDPSGL